MAGLLYGGPGISPVRKSILMMATIAAWELLGGSLLLGMVGGNVMYYLSWMQWAFRDRFDLIEGYMYPMLHWRDGSELRESGRRHLGNIIVRASLRRYMTASSCTNSLRFSQTLSDHQPTWTSRFHHPTQLYQQPF